MMRADREQVARIGMVAYINTAPIHEIWKERPPVPGWEMIEAHPAALCTMLAENKIDLGFVSSYEYGIRPEKYRILSDLSISANGPVGSVFLFSRVKPEKLSGLRVLLSNQSKTSVCLVRIILEEFYSIRPEYFTAEVKDARKEGADAILAIGDDALRLKLEGSYQYCLDLGEEWKINTRLPFVFAVCAVREEFCLHSEETLASVHRQLVECKAQGVNQLDYVCSKAAPRIPMAVEQCRDYLKGIQYDLDADKREALVTFYRYLIKYGEAAEHALPLRIQELIT